MGNDNKTAWFVRHDGADHCHDSREEAEAFASEKGLPPSVVVEGDNPYYADFTRRCENCGETPVVNVTGMCGPCTFGEAATAWFFGFADACRALLED